METIEKWGKDAFRRVQDLEEVVEQKGYELSRVKSEVANLAANGGTAQPEASGCGQVNIYFGHFEKITVQKSCVVAELKAGAEEVLRMDIMFDIQSETTDSGEALVEVLLGTEVFMAQVVRFEEHRSCVELSKYYYPTGESDKMSLRVTPKTAAESGGLIGCKLLDIAIFCQGANPVFETKSHNIVFGAKSYRPETDPGTIWYAWRDGTGMHVSMYNTATGETTSKDDASLGYYKAIVLNETREPMRIKVQVLVSRPANVVYEEIPLFVLQYYDYLKDGGIVTKLMHTTASAYSIRPSVNSGYFTDFCILEINNPNCYGYTGITEQFIVNAYMGGLAGHSSHDNGVGWYISAIRYRYQNSINTGTELPCTVEDTEELFTVNSIQDNAQGYNAMAVFRCSNNDLYFQPYVFNMENYLQNWLLQAGNPIKVGTGTEVTAYHENGVVRFYFIRSGKVYSTSLNLATGEVSEETLVCEADYYMESALGFHRRVAHRATFVAK